MRSQLAMLAAVITASCHPLPALANTECNKTQLEVLEKARSIMLDNNKFEYICKDGLILFRDTTTHPYTMAIDQKGVVGACAQEQCTVPSLDPKESLEYFQNRYKERVEKGMI